MQNPPRWYYPLVAACAVVVALSTLVMAKSSYTAAHPSLFDRMQTWDALRND